MPPYPPLALMERVGRVSQADDPAHRFDELGSASKRSIERVLPADWRWAGARVLDFGCGAGRTLRHFLDEAEHARFVGCDIDGDSVAWVRANLCPPVADAVVNGGEPPLPFADGSFDLVYAVSVFTHLTTTWAAWLLELNRVLADGGLLVATFMGEGAAAWVTDEPWDENRVGMRVLREGQSWDLGGPMVLHSPWWLAEHWGRVLDVVRIEPYGFGYDDDRRAGHGIVVARRRGPSSCTPADLEAPGGDLRRQAVALAAQVDALRREVVELRGSAPAQPPVAVPAPPPSGADLARRARRVARTALSHAERRLAERRGVVRGPAATITSLARRTAPYVSSSGGLWVDRTDAADLVDRAVEAGVATAAEGGLLRSFVERGYASVPGAVAPETAARLARDVEFAVEHGDPRHLATVEGHEGARPTRVEPWMRHRSSTKILDAYAHEASAREVLLAPALTRLLRLLFDGATPVLFQSLNFVRGSEQWLHRDTAYVKVNDPLALVGCWVALEDVAPGSGELAYVAGSHRFETEPFAGRYRSWSPDDGQAAHQAWIDALSRLASEAGLETERLRPRAGDAFLWHADLMHGGAPIEREGATRRSVVGHFCPEPVLPLYVSERSRVRRPFGDALYSSDHHEVGGR